MSSKTKSKRKKKTNFLSEEAYLYYFTLGITNPKERNLRAVAQRYNVSLATVKKWSSKYKWQKRVEKDEKEILDRLKDKFMGDIEKYKESMIKVCMILLNRFIDNIKRNFVDPMTIADFEKIAKLFLLLTGDNTERSENIIKIISAIPRPTTDDNRPK